MGEKKAALEYKKYQESLSEQKRIRNKIKSFLVPYLSSPFSPESLSFSFLSTQKKMQVIYKQGKRVNRSASKQTLDKGSGWIIKYKQAIDECSWLCIYFTHFFKEISMSLATKFPDYVQCWEGQE